MTRLIRMVQSFQTNYIGGSFELKTNSREKRVIDYAKLIDKISENLDAWADWARRERGPHIAKQDIVLVISHIKAEKSRLTSYPYIDPLTEQEDGDTSNLTLHTPLLTTRSSWGTQDYLSRMVTCSNNFNNPDDTGETPKDCIFISGLFIGVKDEVERLGWAGATTGTLLQTRTEGMHSENNNIGLNGQEVTLGMSYSVYKVGY